MSLLSSSNLDEVERGMSYLDFGADAVGNALIKRSAAAHGKLYALQLAAGIEKEKRVGFDRFSTMIKAGDIPGIEGRSDISAVAGNFSKALMEQLENLGLIDASGVAPILTDKASGLDYILEEYRKALTLSGNARTAESSKALSVALKEELLDNFGLSKERQLVSLNEIADKEAKTIREALASFRDSSQRAAAVSEAENIRATLNPGARDIMDPFIESLKRETDGLLTPERIAQGHTGQTLLEEYHQAQEIIRQTKNATYLSPKNRTHRVILEQMDELFGLDLSASDTSLKEMQLKPALEMAQSLKQRISEAMGNKIFSNFEEVGREGPAAVVNQIQMLLAKQRELRSYAIEEDALAERGLVGIIDDFFEPDSFGGRTIKLSGVDYNISDLHSLAKNKNIVELLAGSGDTSVGAISDDVVDFMRMQSGVSDINIDVFGMDFLEQNFGYRFGVGEATSETRRLISIPKFMDVSDMMDFGTEEYIKVAAPKARTVVVPKLIDLNVVGVRDTLAKVSIDMQFIEDLAALSNSSAENINDIEALISESFESRLRQKYASASRVISDDEALQLSRSYVSFLRKVKVHRQSKYELLKTMQRLNIVGEEARAAAAAIDPSNASAIRTLSESLEETATAGVDTPGVISVEDLEEQLSRRIAEAERASAESFETLAGVTDEAPVTAKFTPFGEMIRKFYKGQGGKASTFFAANKGKIAIASGITATAAAGLAVFGMKLRKDRTEDDITGPPLLPGGNPYETLPNNQSPILASSAESSGMGTSYNVSINSNQEEVQKFMNAAGSFTNGQVEGTMHNSLPNLGGDSYDDIAGSF